MRRTRSFVTTLAIAAWAAAPAAAQVRIDNAKLQRHSAAAGLDRTFKALVTIQADPFWIGYAGPVVDGDRIMCCFGSGTTWIEGTVFVRDGEAACCGSCRLEPETGVTFSSSGGGAGSLGVVRLEGDRFTIFFRIVGGRIDRVRTFSEQCGLDAGGRVVHWIDDVRPAESVALLESLIMGTVTFSRSSSGEKVTVPENRVTDGAIGAIALHDDPAADAALDRLVARDRPEFIRKKAAFWMGQARGRRGFETLRRLVADDPSLTFRKSAVFALSQSREAEAVPALIALAKRDESATIRGEALFWLAQKAGQKAAEAITEAIEQDPETEVKKKAVFALSQLPKDEGVPLLIRIARTNRNAAVRKQAIFWLGQSRDPRALVFFEEILK
jgi:hypothetical protein